MHFGNTFIFMDAGLDYPSSPIVFAPTTAYLSVLDIQT